ncbi:MAG: MoaD/ThiS family protein [Candidatus Aenigmatarchaeota archaeon]
MKIKIIFEGKKRVVEYRKNMSIIELAKKNNIILPNYVVKINGELVPEDEKIKENDKIEFIRITSGG